MSIKGILSDLAGAALNVGTEQEQETQASETTALPATPLNESYAATRINDLAFEGNYKRQQALAALSLLAAPDPTVIAQGTQQRPVADPPAYTEADVHRLFGENAQFTARDTWVNVITRREGTFSDSRDLSDGGGLSVGIFQWTQNSGNLGALMQKYHDVAEAEGKLDEFNRVFGGERNANRLLQVLRDSPGNISSASIRGMFAEAGRRDLFKKAQIEKAREDLPDRLRGIADGHPYAQNGTISAQSLAAILVTRNIGPNLTQRVYKQTISELYADLIRQNPQARADVQGKAVTDDLKQEIVTRYVSEADFNQRLITAAPRALYGRANYQRFHTGVENRLRNVINLFQPDERVNPNEI